MPDFGPRILIVDDHADLADSVCELLTLSGHSAAAVYGAEDVARVCRAGRPDVVILDFRIGPGMNGIELLGALRRIRPDLVGILMTSDQEHETVVSSLKAGVFDFVRKPAEPQEILAAVEKAVVFAADRSQKNEELYKLNEDAKSAELRRGFLRSLSAEIREPLSLIMGNAELLAASAEGRGGTLAQIAKDIRGGVEALLERVALAKDLARAEAFDEVESERIAVTPLLRDVCNKLESKATASQVGIDLTEPSVPAHVQSSKLHLRRILHLLADGLLSLAPPDSILHMTVASEGRETFLRMSLSAGAGPGRSELPSGFSVALALACRLGIATGLRLDGQRGHEVALTLPAADPS